MAKLRDAQALHKLGWRVVAAPLAGKAPIGSWKAAQTKPATPEELQEAFAKDHNIFIITGAISRLAVLDCDDQAAADYWRDRLGSVLDETTCVNTGRGHHYYFRLAEGETHKGRSSLGGGSGKWDLRADGGGVVAPPSIHPTGRVYRWGRGRGPDALQDAPDALWADEKKSSSNTTGPSSLLSHLLTKPPEEGERNNWLAKVAGHLAIIHPHQDAFEETVRGYGQQIGLEVPEIEKLIRSIWESEQAKIGKGPPEPAAEGEGGSWRITNCTEESGWLMSGDIRILTQIRERDSDGNWQAAIAPWLNADLRAIGIFEMPDDTRLYHVEVRTQDRIYDGDVSSKTLGDNKALVQWLAGFGVSLAAPDGIYPRGMASGARLVRYLEVQQPPVQLAVTALGWHEESGAFITHEGLLRSDGFAPFEAVRPAPRVRQWAPYVYGLDGAEHTAQDVLSEVLTFHDERVAAVFGAWWAACLLKPQIAREFSQFPFMALEAPSESGKTTGYFPLMLELAGNTQGNSNPTRAAMRDYLSAHRSGIVWVDDLDNLDALGELIRSTTVSGTVVKKALNQSDQISVQLVAALCVSGESLGLHGQKALLDRSIGLEVPSPVGRRSLHGDYSQFQDIVELKRKHPTLSDYAGTYMVRALKLVPEIPSKALTLREGDGRLMDKLTIMRLGVWVLRTLIDHESSEWVDRHVEGWVAEQLANYDPADNSLTMQLLPAALKRLGRPGQPMGPDTSRSRPASPVFIRAQKSDIWFNPTLLAEWWSDIHYGRIDQRTASAEALKQQANAIGAGGRKGVDRRYFKYSTGTGGANYWRLPDDIAEQVILRSEA
jgi:hypothetical protein